MQCPDSKQIAGSVGPTIIAMVITEFLLVQPHLYDAQIPLVVYLSGAWMFLAGLAIVRAHTNWAWDWTVLVTMSGWSSLLVGLIRMFAAGRYQQGGGEDGRVRLHGLGNLLLVCGLVMIFKAYRRGAR